MTKTNADKIILYISILLSILISISSLTGLLLPQIYKNETQNWFIQSIGQDFANIFFAVPFLLCTAIFSLKGSLKAVLMWTGTLLYLIYTFLIYCFNVHFNSLFIVYCLILGISFYSFLYFFFIVIKERFIIIKERKVRIFNITGIYFIVIAGLFYFLWLSIILPPIFTNETPAELKETGLFTNPIHVIDLSFLLPALCITGILILKRNRLGLFMAPPLFVFTIIMDLTIAALVFIMDHKGVGSGLLLFYIMSVLALISSVLLVIYLKNFPLRST